MTSSLTLRVTAVERLQTMSLVAAMALQMK
jgi:hypothetical protein